ncbi:MAG: YabP/YqfC family sporulation protein [Firmicutes bacterium]|nr:YabP/YqfC family sporulation protein [Bacillota bacterium]
MIDMKDELLFDFSINSSRVLITDKLALIDNVIRIVDFTDSVIVIQNGKKSYTSIKGNDLTVSSFRESRIICTGRIESVEFIKPESKKE